MGPGEGRLAAPTRFSRRALNSHSPRFALPVGLDFFPLGLPTGTCASPSGTLRSSHWEAPTSHSESQWELRNQVPLWGRNGASGSCKARLEKRVGAARRPSPGPTRTSHWEARHYRAIGSTCGP